MWAVVGLVGFVGWQGDRVLGTCGKLQGLSAACTNYLGLLQPAKKATGTGSIAHAPDISHYCSQSIFLPCFNGPVVCVLLQVIDITYDVSAGPEGLLPALQDVCDQAQVCAASCHKA